MSSPVWTPGETVLQRFVRNDGTIGQHHPLRVLADDGESLLGWLPKDTEIIGTRLVDGRDPRDAPMAERFTLPRQRCLAYWRTTSNVRLITESHWSSVWWFFAADGVFTGWYVNLELPRGRTEQTTDRVDGALDVVVAADRRWRWKDEDEAAASVAAGRITAAELAGLRAEGERIISLVESVAFPFDGSFCDFRPDPDWPAPVLPPGFRS
ncbi:MAG TPA: DUF402 domain-containing protein [Pseudonocardiaceae bacterium]|jgi:hypothetical protein|nr:DUF402 domain-containing protein [Pseudonocardiaceae bacterium]